MIIMFTDLLSTRGKASQMVQWVVSLPAGQGTLEIWVRFPGREDPLEEGTATHFSILAWRIPWTEEPGTLLQSMGSQSLTWLKRLSTHTAQRKNRTLNDKVFPFSFLFFFLIGTHCLHSARRLPPQVLPSYIFNLLCGGAGSYQSCLCVFVFLISYVFVSMSF